MHFSMLHVLHAACTYASNTKSNVEVVEVRIERLRGWYADQRLPLSALVDLHERGFW